MNKKVVAKFGGSSVKNADTLKQVAAIIQDTKPILVVLSATYNTTNQLEALADAAARGSGVETLLEGLKIKHFNIAKDLSLLDQSQTQTQIESLMLEVSSLCDHGPLNKKEMDRLYSTGERFSSGILFEHLTSLDIKCSYIDARKFIKTDSSFGSALPDLMKIQKKCEELQKQIGNSLIITQGFIGSNDKGETTTLGREGSDYSAVLFAEALKADEVNIWTDVAGVANFDPRKCKDPKFLDYLSYDQAQLLAENGAKVLFPRTLEPVKRMEIPLFVKSTFAPAKGGTKISNQEKNCNKKPLAMALDEDILTVVGGNNIEIRSLLGQEEIESNDRFIRFKLSSVSIIEKLHHLLFLAEK